LFQQPGNKTGMSIPNYVIPLKGTTLLPNKYPAKQLHQFLELEDHLYLGYLYKGDSYCCIIKKSDQSIVFNSSLIDFSTIHASQEYGFVVGATKRELILSVNAIDYKDGFSQDNKSIKKIKKDDNPVLFFIKLN